VLERGYFALVKHANRVLWIRVWHGMAEEGVIKWVWGSLGLGICAIPVFAGGALGMEKGDLGSRTEGGCSWGVALGLKRKADWYRLCDE
jgi:ATP-binding cassette subfamily D (ALD) long-chain fatty acid import protein